MKLWVTHQANRCIRKLLFGMVLLIVCGQPALALELTDELLQKTSLDLSEETLLLNDPDNRLNPVTVIERISQPDYRTDELLPAGQQYWFYIPLINRSSTSQWAIRSDHPLSDELDFYVHCQGQPLQFIPRPALGLNSPNLAAAHFIPIVLPQDTRCGFLQRGQSPIFDAIRISLVPHAKMTWQSNLKTTLTLLGMGVVIGLILYNFMLYLSLRNSMYLIYIAYAVLHLTGTVLLHFNPEPLSNLFESSRHALRAIGAGLMLSFILFTLRFMQPGIQRLGKQPEKKRLFMLTKTFVLLNWMAFTLMLLVLLAAILYPNSLAQTAKVYPFIYMSCILLIPSLSLMVALSGYKPAWVFLPAWTILTASHVLFVLDGLRIIELQGLAATYGVLAAALEMVLLSIALGLAIRETQTARDRAQMARENAELRMEQQEKFVSTLSHEIRTPLHAMLGSTTLLGRTPLSDQQKNYLNTTHYAAESMYELVDNLLDRTQAKQARITDRTTIFEPQRLLEAMVRLLRSRAEEKGLSLSLISTALPQYLLGNPVVLRRALINLTSNAVKYSDAGDITVHATWSAESSALYITIKDNGHGMSSEQLSHIRQVFNMGVEALYSQNASSGLGLPICFEMLQEAGGELSLESQPNQGTTAYFYLPMRLASTADEDKHDTQAITTTTTPHLNTALAVLVVDDVQSNRMIASELLKSAGHQVKTADSGQQALALTREHAFDAVLSDVRMPGMDGAQLLEQLRREYSNEELTIVMTSAHFDKSQETTLLAMGATLCLAKPHSPEALLTAIQGIIPEPHQSSPLTTQQSTHILALYNQQLREDISHIRQALEQQDRKTIHVSAHRIVSASRALGLQDNANNALQIEAYSENKKSLDWAVFRQLIKESLQRLES